MSAEQEPGLPLDLGKGRRMEMTPRNSTLYTFMGRTAVTSGSDVFEIENSSVNHVWVQTREDAGMYFFAEHDECYAEMAAFMVEHSFPMVLNSRTVSPADLQAWLREVDKTTEQFVASIPDSLPDK